MRLAHLIPDAVYSVIRCPVHSCHRYKRNYLFSTSSIALTRLHRWVHFRSTHIHAPTEVIASVFPNRSPPACFQGSQHLVVWQLFLKIVAERPALICIKAPTIKLIVVQVTHVLGLCDGGAIEAQIFSFAQKLNRRTAVELCSFGPLLQNPCYMPFLYFHLINS